MGLIQRLSQTGSNIKGKLAMLGLASILSLSSVQPAHAIPEITFYKVETSKQQRDGKSQKTLKIETKRYDTKDTFEKFDIALTLDSQNDYKIKTCSIQVVVPNYVALDSAIAKPIYNKGMEEVDLLNPKKDTSIGGMFVNIIKENLPSPIKDSAPGELKGITELAKQLDRRLNTIPENGEWPLNPNRPELEEILIQSGYRVIQLPMYQGSTAKRANNIHYSFSFRTVQRKETFTRNGKEETIIIPPKGTVPDVWFLYDAKVDKIAPPSPYAWELYGNWAACQEKLVPEDRRVGVRKNVNATTNPENTKKLNLPQKIFQQDISNISTSNSNGFYLSFKDSYIFENRRHVINPQLANHNTITIGDNIPDVAIVANSLLTNEWGREIGKPGAYGSVYFIVDSDALEKYSKFLATFSGNKSEGGIELKLQPTNIPRLFAKEMNSIHPIPTYGFPRFEAIE